MKPTFLMKTVLVALVSCQSINVFALPIFDNAVFNVMDEDFDPEFPLVVSIEQGLMVDDEQYNDRDYTFRTLPSEIEGLEWLKTSNDAKNFGNDAELDPFNFLTLTFDVKVDATLYLWFDSRVGSAPEWVGAPTFVDTGLDLTTNETNGSVRTFDIYSTEVEADSSVVTGAQNCCSFYGLAAAAARDDEPQPMPSPATLLLLGVGLGLGAMRSRLQR